MIKIGDFSRLAHVSIKTLHHYDELGLLPPAHIDRFSGYRYYALEQMAVLNRILALKDLGLSLEQITELLKEKVSPAEMRGMLRLKQIELAARVDEEKSRLKRVEGRLRQIEQESLGEPAAEVALKQVPAQTALVAKVVAAEESLIMQARESLQALLYEQLRRANLKPQGPWFALLDDLPYAETDLELTLGVGIQAAGSQRAGDWEGSPVRLQELAGCPSMASLIHSGEAVTLPQSYGNLYAWTQANGYQTDGPFRELYLSEAGEGADPAESMDAKLIELQCPLAKASIPISILSEKEGIMEAKIVNRPAFKAVGLSYVGKNEHAEISQMWGRFNRNCGPIKNINRNEAFGLCFTKVAGSARPGEFEYVASFEVADDKDIPAGMVYREVPAYKYAVFTHHGKLDTLTATYQYIYNTGLAQAGQKTHADMFDMEVYDMDFIPESEESKIYIYVAIE
jgi:predicted transcriptional regulator YdeE/DNA-binding transcriptional MerR regulator